jgi:ribosomal protein S18 acetylase RimI-like enzyme
MSDFEIRYADQSDAHAIATLLQEAFQEFKPMYTPEGFLATTPEPQTILLRMREGPIWVAILENQIVATVSVVPKGKLLSIRGMAVHPCARSKGIGRALLDRVESFGRSGKYESMALSTTPFLFTAISLYEKFGFSRTSDGPKDLYGTPLLTMVKKVSHLRGN